jgi:Beta-ketoacyl synthase, N-terminal domain
MSRGPAHLAADVLAIGLLGPGISNWAQGREVLRGSVPYIRQPTVIPVSATLPPAERRRAVRVVNLAMAVALEATGSIPVELTSLPTVFAASVADTKTCDEMLRTLATAERQVSPTRFHNSVHNVAAGYWSIATGDTAPYTTVCAYDGSFAAGMIEALSLVALSDKPVMLVAYDLDFPSPLREKRAIEDAFAVALVLRATPAAASICTLACTLGGESVAPLNRPELESLRRSAPAARALPLLEVIASGRVGITCLEYLGNLSLLTTVTPCH